MTDLSKIKPSHTQRAAFVYVRQSTPGQVEHNRESTARQYALADRACQLGWSKEQVVIVDEDLGLSGSSTDKRSGFARLTSEVALAHVGIVLGLEVSRLAREGSALLQGLVTCGHCGRRLHVHYRGRNSAPGYHCAGKDLVNGRGVYCLNVGGTLLEQAVANAFLEAITPAAIEATRLSVEQLQANHDAALSQWRLEAERTRYEAERAERRYRTVEPENRLVARGLETEWENRLRDLAAAEMELRRREQQRPSRLDPEQLRRLQMLGSDIRLVWTAPTTTDRDRKELLRTLLEEVVLNLKRAEGHAHLTLRWRGGAITTLDVAVPKFRPMGPRTDEDTISLLRRLAALYPDEVIAGIFNRQGRKTATGERFTANQVGSLRRYRNIPRFQPPDAPPSGELVSIRKAAQILGMNTSSIHRWLADGFMAGEQVTPGAPWQIRITDELRARIVQQAPPEYLPMLETTHETRRFAPDGVAACKARRARSRAGTARST